MNNINSKLALGGANFGLNYGLLNVSGKLTDSTLKQILECARRAQIELIDTAQAYGDSEQRIGKMVKTQSFKISTKISPSSDLLYLKDDTRNRVELSLKRTNQPRLYAVMLHQPEILLSKGGSSIIDVLQELKEKKIISKIGISIYSPAILEQIFNLYNFDVVQAPFNIFDQEILSSNWSNKLKERGVEIHTRSVFLQGLLLTPEQNLPSYFYQNWSNLFTNWYKFLSKNNIDPLTLSLKFALKQDWIDKVVVGVDKVSQLQSLINIEKSSVPLEYPQISSNDPNLINPTNWPK